MHRLNESSSTYDNFIFALPQLLRSDLIDHRRVGEASHCIMSIFGGLAGGKMKRFNSDMSLKIFDIFTCNESDISPCMISAMAIVSLLNLSKFQKYRTNFLMGKIAFSWMYDI